MKKSSSSVIIVIVIVLAIVTIFTLLFGTSSVSYYNVDKKNGLSGYNVEGFSHFHPYHYASYPGNSNIDRGSSRLINKSNDNVQRVHGFDGLFGSSNIPDNNLDIFASANGSTEQKCFSNSSGLTNSRGALCLDSNQINLLRTRGGNQTGAASVVGNSSV
jgi:hypothetical protein